MRQTNVSIIMAAAVVGGQRRRGTSSSNGRANSVKKKINSPPLNYDTRNFQLPKLINGSDTEVGFAPYNSSKSFPSRGGMNLIYFVRNTIEFARQKNHNSHD